MADIGSIDTSSYPKPQPQANPLDTVAKFQSLQSNDLAIQKQKLDLVNQRFGEFAKGFTSLIADNDLNEDKVRQYVTNQVKLGYMNNEQAAAFIGQLPPTQGMDGAAAQLALKGNLQQNLTHAMTVQQALNYHLGSEPQLQDTGGGLQPVTTSQKPGFGVRSAGLPIQKTPAPGTPQFSGNSGRPELAGGNPQPGMVAAPPASPVMGGPQAAVPTPQARPALPVVSGPSGPTVERKDLEAPSFDDRFKGERKFAAPPVNFEEGRKAYAADQDLATQKLTAIKPAALALDLIHKLDSSGPGTKLWTEAVAGLKSNGIIPTSGKDDPTAVTQEVNKYLSQYLKGRGGRSDADLQAAEESSPNVGTQIKPALIKLTQSAIAQDRIEAARARAFSDDKGTSRTDFENYLQHRSSFPQQMDERAFIADKLAPDEKQELAKQIAQMKPDEKKRFVNSLRVFKQSGVGQ